MIEHVVYRAQWAQLIGPPDSGIPEATDAHKITPDIECRVLSFDDAAYAAGAHQPVFEIPTRVGPIYLTRSDLEWVIEHMDRHVNQQK